MANKENKVQCKVLKFFGAYQEYEKGDIVELPESKFSQLHATGTVEPINSNDSAKDKQFKGGNKK